MDPKKRRINLTKTEVPTDTPTDFELGDTAVDRGGGRRENREKRRQRNNRGGRRGRRPEGPKIPQSHIEEGVAEKRP